VDLKQGVLTVRRSYDRSTTKGGHADAIPIAAPLAPYLRDAIENLPGAYVFPAAEGRMRREDLAPQKILRRALARNGLVENPPV